MALVHSPGTSHVDQEGNVGHIWWTISSLEPATTAGCWAATPAGSRVYTGPAGDRRGQVHASCWPQSRSEALGSGRFSRGLTHEQRMCRRHVTSLQEALALVSGLLPGTEGGCLPAWKGTLLLGPPVNRPLPQ